MNFSGKNLLLVREAIIGAIADVHNQIATCPDVFEYAEDLAECEKTRVQYNRLLYRVERAIERGDA